MDQLTFSSVLTQSLFYSLSINWTNFENFFWVDSNGITLKVSQDTPFGTEIEYNDSIYTVIDEPTLRHSADNWDNPTKGYDLSKVITSRVTYMRRLFIIDSDYEYGQDQFNQDISNWDTSNVTNM